MRANSVAGMLDEPELAVRVRAELLRVVVQRRLYASDHAVNVPRMGRMVKDLDRGILPRRFMHRVGRGEERVVIPDRNIGRVVKVAPSALRPRPAQPSGRDGDLTFARANDRLERDPSGSRPPAGRDRSQKRLKSFSSMRPPIYGGVRETLSGWEDV